LDLGGAGDPEHAFLVAATDVAAFLPLVVRENHGNDDNAAEIINSH